MSKRKQATADTDVSSQTLQSGEVSLHVREWGAADQASATIVLVHGYPDASHVWDKTAALLARQFHVVAYDVRGAGESDAPKHTKAYALDKLVGDFRTVIDAVCPDRPVHLVAHDWGSIQSWESVTDPELADRIASYTSISGPCLDHAGYWVSQRLRQANAGSAGELARQAAHSWYIGAFHLPLLGPTAWKLGLDQYWPKLLKALEGIDADAAPSQRKDGVHGVKLYRANVSKRVLRPRPRKTAVPVQLIVPLGDRFVSPELLDDVSRWAPRLWRFDVEGTHWIQVSDPERVAQMVTRFVEFIDSGADDTDAGPQLRRARDRALAEKELSGQVAVVTGAGGGIGRETLLALAEAGAEVVAVDINTDANARTVELAELLGARAHTRTVDVGDADAMQDLASWVQDTLGTPDIVINNAGIGLAGKFLDTGLDDWERVLRVNLWSVIHGSKLFAQQMHDSGRAGVIVNVASAAAFTPSRSLSAYATTKAAVRMLSDCLRAELADQGIRVLSVCPGLINTGITTSTRFVGHGADDEAAQQSRAKDLYTRRGLGPESVANSILKAIRHGDDEALVGLEAHGFHWISRIAPRLSRRLARLHLTG